MQACDRCHSRKTRCDRRFPQCGACEKAGVSCVHADKLRQRNIPRGYLDNMETLVRQLQQENDALRQSLAAAGRATAAGATATPASTAGTSSGCADGDAGISGSCAAVSGSHGDRALTEAPVTPPPSSSAGRESPPDNAFAVEVGFLSLIATGETRYLGSSSGLGLANIISTMVNSQTGLGHELPECAGARAGVAAPSDAGLPPLVSVAPFIEAYFQHTHITFPLLHRPSFLAIVDRIYEEPTFYDDNPYEAFLFDMVLAIGSSNFNRFEESAASSSQYFSTAQSKLGAVLSMDGLTSLKAILLVSQHGIFSNLRDTSASIWHLVGIGARICIELGLHLERKQLGCAAQDHQQPVSATLDEEMRRRCFWSLYNLDRSVLLTACYFRLPFAASALVTSAYSRYHAYRVVSFTLGRPLAIRDEEIDVPLPSHLDDDFFSPGLPVAVSPLGASNPSCRLSPFLHVIRIRRLSGQILTQFYNSRHQTKMPLEERRRIRRNFHAEIDAWRDDTQRLSGLFSAGADSGYRSSFLTPDWYKAVYSNAILLLYRPSPFLPHPRLTSDSDHEEPELTLLLNAAQSSIESYSHLHRMRRLNYSWITLHGVFMAGLAYIYSLGRLLRDPATVNLIPELFSVVEVTRACSNVLVAICERWNASRRSCDLFNKLSNALIRDALDASSRQSQDGSLRYAAAARPPSAAYSRQPKTPSSTHRNGRGGQTMHHQQMAMDEATHGQVQLDENLVMDEFRQFMSSFDALHPGESSVPSELVSGFLQDWPFDVPVAAEGVDLGGNDPESDTNLLNWGHGAG